VVIAASVALATEDALSEALGLRLLVAWLPQAEVGPLLRKGGFGYLRSGMPKWRALARRQAVIVLTDLDRKPCASALLDDWVGHDPLPQALLLRVAVRSAESWLLADHAAMRRLIGPRGSLPAEPDSLPDPKAALLRLARSAPRDVRLDLIQAEGAVASQGIGYNARLTALVRNEWDADRAADRSPSLARCRDRLSQLGARFN
jgi:hypothetical protein